MSNHDNVVKAFQSMGARALIDLGPARARGWNDLGLDIGRDRRGEFFRIIIPEPERADVCVLDVRPRLRHLVLGGLAVSAGAKTAVTSRFLCGHDEREWFVAALPAEKRVTTVVQAMETLKPTIVLDSQVRHAVRTTKRNRRHNDGFVRQGEWFFVPQPGLDVTGLKVDRDAPLIRGFSKPHMAEELVRQGGEQVRFSQQYPDGLTDEEYTRLMIRDARAARDRWQMGVRNSVPYVRGRIRHPDHRTVTLAFWHRAVPNTEGGASGWRFVGSLD